MGLNKSLDFSGCGTGFREIPEGIYNVTLFDIKELPMTSNGNDVLELTFKIQDGEYKGLSVKDKLFLSTKAMWRVRDLLTACGVAIDQKMNVDFNKIIGSPLRIKVEQEYVTEGKYAGKSFPRAESFLAAEDKTMDNWSDGVNEISDDEIPFG